MDKPDASPWPHGSEAPVVIALTDDERLHPMDAFADEWPQAERPPQEESTVYERVPATPPATRDVRTAPPVQPEIWRSQVWPVRRWAVVLAASVVVYTATTLVLMRITPRGPIATANERSAQSKQAVPLMPEAVAVSAMPRPAAVAAAPEPAAVVAIATSTAEEPKTRAVVAIRESRRDAPPVRSDPPVQRVSVSRPRTAEPLPIAEAPVTPLPPSPLPPAALAAEPRRVVDVPASSSRPEAIAAPVPRRSSPEAAIQTVLTRYQTAYRNLDAVAARAVWPSVDTKALGKAFDRLERQDVTFDSCAIAVSDIGAVASCEGFARYVPRVGNKAPHDDRRQWDFTLSRVDDIWQIDTVSAR